MRYFILILALHHVHGQLPTICPEFPVEPCGPDELSCSVGSDPYGCPFPDWCMPIDSYWDEYFPGCPPQSCPVTCDWENEVLCQEGWNGPCPPTEFCAAKTSPECPAFCPVTCDPTTEDFCPGVTDYITGCETPGMCFVKPKDINGDFCPSNCPVMCNHDETMCFGGVDQLGCRMPDTCSPVNPECPYSNPCPAVCSPYEIRCPGGFEQGCPMPDFCMAQMRGYDGEECPVFCPIQCNDDEIYCPGQINFNGCSSPDICQTRMMDATGNFCPGFCPTDCGPNEMLCAGGVDCYGCPIQDTCMHQEGIINVCANYHYPKHINKIVTFIDIVLI